MTEPTELKPEDIVNFAFVSVQLSKRLPDGSSRHTMTHTVGLFPTDEEAIGAAVLYAKEQYPDHGVDQWIVSRPFDLAHDEDEDEEYFDENEESYVPVIASTLTPLERQWLTGWEGTAGAAFNTVANALHRKGLLVSAQDWNLNERGEQVKAHLLKGTD